MFVDTVLPASISHLNRLSLESSFGRQVYYPISILFRCLVLVFMGCRGWTRCMDRADVHGSMAV